MRGYVAKSIAAMLLAAVGFVWTASDALAIPAFATRENMACSSCHTAWPLLTKFGRTYKENGYQVMRGQPAEQVKISEDLTFAKDWLSLVINGRPYDKKKDGESKIRALHEVEVLAGGNFAGWGSFFVEFEAEDEEDFEIEFAHGIAGFHLDEAFNVVAGKSAAFHIDPYNVLTGRRITRARSRLTTEAGDGEATLGSELQNIAFYGRMGNVFYGAGVGADRDDSEGEGSEDYFARLAVDILDEALMIGGFWIDGEEDITTDLNPVPGVGDPIIVPDPALMIDSMPQYTRYGLDFQGRVGNLNYQGAYMMSDEDTIDGGTGLLSTEESNDILLGELFYTFDCDSKDTFVPLVQLVPFVRIENYERSDGTDDRTDGIFNLTAYFTENFSASVEYFTTLDAGMGSSDYRWTAYFQFGL